MAFSYLITIPGLIKVVEEVFNFIGFMCIACHEWTSKEGDAFLAASVGAFIITGIIIIIYVLDVAEKLPVPLIQVQFFYCLIWAIFYLITSSLVIGWGTDWNDSYIAGGVFGLCATITYLIDAYFKYQKQP